MSKKINQLDAGTDAEAKNDSYLFAQADPVSTMLDQSAINAAGMAPALPRNNRQFKPGTLGYWVNAAKKEIAIISACNVKAKRAATLG